MDKPSGPGVTAGASGDGSGVVIVHDFMETFAGAERIVGHMAAEFPAAPVYTILGRRSVADRVGVGERFTSLLPPRERLLDNYRLAAPALPALLAQMRLPRADVVLSSSYGWSHRLRTPDGAPIVCYSYSPLRFAWSMLGDYRRQWSGGSLSGAAFSAFAAAMRRSDRRSSANVTTYLAPGEYVGGQIERYYGREARVIGIPVDCDRFSPGDEEVGDQFLFAGRLIEPYKQVTLAVKAFTRLGLPLTVAGDGPERGALERIAGPNIDFVGQLGDDELVTAMRTSRALIFPSQDDFGLMPLEMMACGRPVIAYAGGGAPDQIIPGVTGELFAEQTVEALSAAVEQFTSSTYDPARIRSHALQWDSRLFRHRIRAVVEEHL